MIRDIAITRDEDIKILSSLIGQKFLYYEYGEERKFGLKIFQGKINMRLHFSNIHFNLNNNEYEPEGRDNELAWFYLSDINSEKSFKPYAGSFIVPINVNDIVTGVEIIRENVKIIDKDSNEVLEDNKADSAIIIRTENNIYMFYRQYIFDEQIKVVNHDNFEEVYPLEKAKRDWDNDQEYLDVITREIIKL